MIENYPTLQRVVAILQDDPCAHKNLPFEQIDRVATEFNFDRSYLPIAEAELAALPAETLRAVCTTERGIFALKYETDETLEHLAYCLFN